MVNHMNTWTSMWSFFVKRKRLVTVQGLGVLSNTYKQQQFKMLFYWTEASFHLPFVPINACLKLQQQTRIFINISFGLHKSRHHIRLQTESTARILKYSKYDNDKLWEKKTEHLLVMKIRATCTKEWHDINAGYVTWLALRTSMHQMSTVC